MYMRTRREIILYKCYDDIKICNFTSVCSRFCFYIFNVTRSCSIIQNAFNPSGLVKPKSIKTRTPMTAVYNTWDIDTPILVYTYNIHYYYCCFYVVFPPSTIFTFYYSFIRIYIFVSTYMMKKIVARCAEVRTVKILFLVSRPRSCRRARVLQHTSRFSESCRC